MCASMRGITGPPSTKEGGRMLLVFLKCENVPNSRLNYKYQTMLITLAHQICKLNLGKSNQV
jgi:hypothetical protein